MRQSSDRNRSMEYYGLTDVRYIATSAIGRGAVGISRVRCDHDGFGMVGDHEIEDAFLICLQLRRVFADLWVDGRPVAVPGRSDGRVTFYDLRRRWEANFRTAFDTMSFHISHGTFDGLADDYGRWTIENLRPKPGENIDDPVMRGLGLALLPTLRAPEQANRLFVDHIGWALAAHVAQSYGEATPRTASGKGRLARWQEARAKEMIDARLDGDIPLVDLAAACGLSVGHFARAFRQTTNMSPHQWLLQRRIDRAMTLLRETSLPLAEIATACGFSDQSHFTRIFNRIVGATPGTWRRDHYGSRSVRSLLS